ncbi:type II toxin-antitoxin system RelE/ParE family toxin [Bradyrhizobium sp. OAE829]|uniref:type II toxin-antitoxin system RelE/ParE family toxin n=1 Tax=Bradyrhizobium sp. OAE829 TaxID=2663807 RepID=UPI00178A2A8B
MILLSPDAIEDVERLRSFLDENNPGADADIRQIVVRFAASGYIVRYAALHATMDILITRIWHGREART